MLHEQVFTAEGEKVELEEPADLEQVHGVVVLVLGRVTTGRTSGSGDAQTRRRSVVVDKSEILLKIENLTCIF